jgi:aspartyl-tRNA(Asn)/glutamyl-tRNA(Gln) amidotransferase subunit B
VRFIEEWGVSETDARTLIESPGLADFAEAAVAAGAPGKDVVNWTNGEMLGYLNETGLSPAVLPFTPDALAELVDLVDDGTLSRNLAKDVLAECLRHPKRPRAVVEARGLAQVNDEGALGAIVEQILSANPEAIEEYRSGDDKLRKKKRGFLMGEVMKASKGSGNPQTLNRLLDERLK